MRPIVISLLCLPLLFLSHPAAWAEGPTVGANAVASWTNPTKTVRGTPLTNLAGIKVWIGTSSHKYSKSYNAGLVSSLPLSVLKLTDGQYYIAVQAYNTIGGVSDYSDEFAFVLKTRSATNSTESPTTTLGNVTISTIALRVGLPGTMVTIGGKDFTGATAVLFNGSHAKFTMLRNYLIHATLPAGANDGPILVTTPYRTVTSGANLDIP
jgi:hypothetical protein